MGRAKPTDSIDALHALGFFVAVVAVIVFTILLVDSMAEESIEDEYTKQLKIAIAGSIWDGIKAHMEISHGQGFTTKTLLIPKGTVIQIRDDGEPTTTGQILFSILMPDGSTAFEIGVPPPPEPVDPTLEECPYILPAEMPYMPVEYPRWHGTGCTHGLYDPVWDFSTTDTLIQVILK